MMIHGSLINGSQSRAETRYTDVPNRQVSIEVHTSPSPLVPPSGAGGRWSALRDLAKVTLSKGASQFASSALGSSLGLGAKALMVHAAAKHPQFTATVVFVGLGFICAVGLVCGYRATSLAKLRDQSHGGEITHALKSLRDGSVYDRLYNLLEVAPAAVPVGKVLILTLLVQTLNPLTSSDPVQDTLERMTPFVADSVGSVVCSVGREFISAILKGVGPEGLVVDSLMQPLDRDESRRFQQFSTGMQCTLDGLLAVGVNMQAPDRIQALLAPFGRGSDVLLYAGLRTGFGMLQEVARGLTAYVMGGQVQARPAGQWTRLQENLTQPARHRTWDTMGHHIATRVTTTSIVAEPLMIGDLGHSGLVKFVSAVLLGAGEARGTYTDQGIEALKAWEALLDNKFDPN